MKNLKEIQEKILSIKSLKEDMNNKYDGLIKLLHEEQGDGTTNIDPQDATCDWIQLKSSSIWVSPIPFCMDRLVSCYGKDNRLKFLVKFNPNITTITEVIETIKKTFNTFDWSYTEVDVYLNEKVFATMDEYTIHMVYFDFKDLPTIKEYNRNIIRMILLLAARNIINPFFPEHIIIIYDNYDVICNVYDMVFNTKKYDNQILISTIIEIMKYKYHELI